MSPRSTALKSRILNTAHAMFSEKGYERATVNEIIDHLNISKGAFYHYFKSKQEVLDEIILIYIHEVVELLYQIAYDNTLNGLEKYKKMFVEIQRMRKQNYHKYAFLTRLLLHKDNLLFQHRYTEKTLELTKPPFVHILQQGVKERLFVILNPEETAELILRFGNIYRAKIARLSIALKDNPNNQIKIRNIIEFMQDTIERLLGVKSGQLDFILENFESSTTIE